MPSKRFKQLPEKTKNLPADAIESLLSIVKKNCTTKFDESIDLSFQVNNKQKKGEVNIRTVVNLPGGTGKKVKVAVVCEDAKAKEAKDAGADIVGSDEFIEKIKSETLSIPNLIEVQKNSYKQLTDFDSDAGDLTKGFDRVFKGIFPIEDLNDKATLEYVSYRLEKPKFDTEECIQRGLSFTSALKCTLRLVVYEIDQENNTKDILSAKEQEVYMGEVPMMTDSGTFITNGVQRVVVNQMHRSPGVFFDHDKGKSHASGKLLFNCRVIPNRGSWLDLEYDVKDFLYFKIDRKKKIFVSTLLMALGFTKTEIADEFYDKETYTFDPKTNKWKTKFNPENYKAKNFSEEVMDAKNGNVVIKLGDKINFLTAKKLANDGLKDILVSQESLYGKYLHKEVVVSDERGRRYFWNWN